MRQDKDGEGVPGSDTYIYILYIRNIFFYFLLRTVFLFFWLWYHVADLSRDYGKNTNMFMHVLSYFVFRSSNKILKKYLFLQKNGKSYYIFNSSSCFSAKSYVF